MSASSARLEQLRAALRGRYDIDRPVGRGRDGGGLACAGREARPPGGREDPPARAGPVAGRGTLRARDRHRGEAQPSQHRRRHRLGRDRRRRRAAAVLRHAAGRGAVPPRPARARGSHVGGRGASPRRRGGRCARLRACARGGAPRREAGQHPHPGRARAGGRLRHRARHRRGGAGRGRADHGVGGGHAHLHEPGAVPRRRADRRPQRHLQPWLRAVRDAGRRARPSRRTRRRP